MLEISKLSVDIRRGTESRRVVDSVSLSVGEHEIVGVVGESGAGKSLMARSILKLLPLAATIRAGEIRFEGTDLLSCSQRDLRSVRGRRIGVVLQDPMSSLDPTMPIGKQVAEPLRVHGERDTKSGEASALEMLELVGLPDPGRLMKAFPHQLSGGMRQRVCIAMALICRPRFLIADEPTTALDVTIQAQILHVLEDMRRQMGLSILLISHDIGVVSSLADRIAVMYDGALVESGTTDDVLTRPADPYTARLLASVPGREVESPHLEPVSAIAARPGPIADPHPPGGPNGARGVNDGSRSGLPGPDTSKGGGEVLRAEHVSKDFPILRGMMRTRDGVLHAVVNVSFTLRESENLALIGESGCGKSTLARMLVGLERPSAGRILVRGSELRSLGRRDLRRARSQIQLMFQDPYSSLDPRMRVLRSVREPLTVQGFGSKGERNERVHQLLRSVGLTSESADLLPHEFSGGQRQRIAFARAVILDPAVVVADEPVSALDVSVRAQVLDVMLQLQRRKHVAYVVISHDISIVRQVAHRTAVMYAGGIVEMGPTASVLGAPRHPYTAGLLASVPTLRGGSRRAVVTVGIKGELAKGEALGTGCPFRTRCPRRQRECDEISPELEHRGSADSSVACHFPLEVGEVLEVQR